MKRPDWDHAFSRYVCVTEGVIEKLQNDYFAGRDLSRAIPGIGAGKAAIIVSETLEADYYLSTLLPRLMDEYDGPPSGPPNDWSWATKAEIFFGVADLALEMGDDQQRSRWLALSWALLEEIARSPTTSPLLWYEDIFLDVAQELRIQGDHEALWFVKRGLAHNLHYEQGSNAPMILRDLAETYLWLDDLDDGLRILTRLLEDDPGDIWIYNLMAIIFDHFGLTEIGAEATRRGLELVEQTGDPHQLHGQLGDALNDLAQSKRRGREAEVDPGVLAGLRAALALDFDAGIHQPPEALCRELVPDLDQIPLKKPPSPPDLPPPEEYTRLPVTEPMRPVQKPGRNDPCWCGSGKKYKHCHLRTDRQGASRG